MRRFRKFCALLLFACLLAPALAGCGAKEDEREEVQALNIYASFYPIYAVASMVSDGVPDLTLHQLVQPQDGCLRAYSLSDWDAALLASADALIVMGGGLESFASALAANEGRLALAQLGTNMELTEVEAENADPEGTPHWVGANPHAYLSVDGGIELAERAAHSLAALDPRYEAQYLENLERAKEQLSGLKAAIAAETAGLKGAKGAVLNEALVYAAGDYGLDALYWARESGESMEDGSLQELLDALDEGNIRLVLIERQAPQSLVEALEAAGLAVAKLDVLSTHRADEGAQAYLDALRGNAEAVRRAYEGISEEEQ